MSPKLRWGLLSTAHINRAVIPPLRHSKRNELVAVASRDQPRAEAYAREWKIPRAIGSYEALLADPGIDVVYISLPNGLHAEWTIRAVQAGKHVLCEKPLAVTVQEVDAIAAAAHQAGVVVAEAFMYRHHPQTQQVADLVASGTLGKIWLVRGAFRYMISKSTDVRLAPTLGGGSIWDVGCYPISYTRALLKMEPIEAFGQKIPGPSGVDLSFAGQMRFPGQVLAQFDCSFQAPSESFMEFIGEEGSVSVPNPFKPGLREKIIVRRGKEEEELRIHGADLYQGEVEDMADAILEGKPPRISLADSRANVATILALLKSAESGQPVIIQE